MPNQAHPASPVVQIVFLAHPEEDVRIFKQTIASLSYQFAYRQIFSLDELREILAEGGLQVVVLRAETDGHDLRAAIDACKTAADRVSVIVVAETPREEAAIALMQAAVNDYILKAYMYRLRWAVQREISRLHQGRQALEAAKNARVTETRLAGLLDVAPDAIIAADSEHRIVVFNKSAERIFGYTGGEIMGRSLETLMPARFAGGHRRRVQAFAREDIPAREMGARRELVGMRKDGSEFPAEASISILQEASGPLFFAVLRDVTDKRRAALEIEHRATHDGLTGLPNRALFTDRFSHALAVGEREEKLVALLFIDLDGFKRVNDMLGHAAGDELLCMVAQRIQETLRQSDTVARLGGDEFAVILEQIPHVDSAGAIAQKIIDQLGEPFPLAGGEATISASIGITLSPFDAKSVKELMIDADRAMYVAKAAGKNRFEFYAAAFGKAGAPGFRAPTMH
jgi:diguanylate cyclase (GGDEF)-like protein/PAS domain S-box-containing protein